MTKQEALEILKLQHEEQDVDEAMVNEVFELKKAVLMKPLVSLLAKKRVLDLLRIHEAYSLLANAQENSLEIIGSDYVWSYPSVKESIESIGNTTALGDGLTLYMSTTAKLKFHFSNSQSALQAAAALKNWIEWEWKWCTALLHCFQAVIPSDFLEAFKQAEKLSDPQLRREIEKLNLETHRISDALLANDLKTSDEQVELWKELNRIKKMLTLKM